MRLRKKTFYFLGELNDDYSCTNSKQRNILSTTRLCQIVETPTRVITNYTTLLNVIITNTPNIIIASEVTPSPIFDHDLISAAINLHKTKHQPLVVTKCQLRNYSPALFCNILCKETRHRRYWSTSQHTYNHLLYMSWFLCPDGQHQVTKVSCSKTSRWNHSTHERKEH